MIKKIINKLFGKKTKVSTKNEDNKVQPKAPEADAKPIIFLQPETSVNSTPKDIKITPSNPVDSKVSTNKPKVQTADKKPQARKPGRPKGQTSKGHVNTNPNKKSVPKNKPNNK